MPSSPPPAGPGPRRLSGPATWPAAWGSPTSPVRAPLKRWAPKRCWWSRKSAWWWKPPPGRCFSTRAWPGPVFAPWSGERLTSWWRPCSCAGATTCWTARWDWARTPSWRRGWWARKAASWAWRRCPCWRRWCGRGFWNTTRSTRACGPRCGASRWWPRTTPSTCRRCPTAPSTWSTSTPCFASPSGKRCICGRGALVSRPRLGGHGEARWRGTASSSKMQEPGVRGAGRGRDRQRAPPIALHRGAPVRGRRR